MYYFFVADIASFAVDAFRLVSVVLESLSGWHSANFLLPRVMQCVFINLMKLQQEDKPWSTHPSTLN